MLLGSGRISAEEIEEAAKKTPKGEGAGGSPLGERLSCLIRGGAVKEEEVAKLLGLLRAEGFPTEDFPTPPLAAGAGREPSPEDFPIKEWERYRVLSVLGSGGMGQVYKAYDPRLQRVVALKVATSGGARQKARFQREARAQARISHENVCRIYEVGEEAGVVYIAMQCIEGQTLHDARGEMTVEEKALVVKKAAEAVHEAHRMGIVHRDIKPGNIMVEREADASWKPYVLDFGLAREFEKEGAEATASIAGTPSFLAPEQAAGKAIDRRVDVYGLGATLYYVLAGSPPFEGTPLETIGQLALGDPPPLRSKAPSVPRELEAVVMKCLEREPGKRYDSAKALALDLQRFIEGEPVLAKRRGAVARLARKAGKHKALSGLFLLAVAAIVISAATGVRSAIRARQQIAAAGHFEQEVLYGEKMLEYAFTAPGGDPRREAARMEEEAARIKNEIAGLGEFAQGPGHYALGRIYLALRKYGEAESELDLAWKRYGYRPPQVAYALGLALASRYRDELGRAALIPPGHQREARLAALHDKYGEPAAAFFNLCKGQWADSRDYGEALLAFLEKRYDDAARLASSSLRAYPWLYDAATLEGDAWYAIGTAAREKGDNKDAMDGYALAAKAYAAAIGRAPNDAAPKEKLGLLETAAMTMAIYQTGASPRAAYDKALEACDGALKADPSSATALAVRAYACWRWGEYQLYRGEEPGQALKEAAEAAGRAVALDPKNTFALNEFGTAYYIKGEWELGHGEDPRPSFALAESAYDKALALDPADVTAWSNMGGLKGMSGQYLLESGGDPRPALGGATGAYQRVLAENPNDARAYSNMGNAYGIEGEYDMRQGLDPTGALARAIGCFKKAAEINPSHANAFANLGVANLALAKYEKRQGKDASGNIREALDNFGKALSIRPDFAAALSGKAEAQAMLAQQQQEAKQKAPKRH